MFQDYLRIVLDSYKTIDKKAVWNYWKNPNTELLGDWEIIYNEATDYNFIDSKLYTSCEDSYSDQYPKVKPVWG